MSKEELKQNIRACLRQMPQKENIKKVMLFGSYLHGHATEKSDVDLLIELQDTVGLFEFVSLQNQLSDFLQKKVDLGQPDALSKYIRDEVLEEAEVVYEKPPRR